MTHLKLFPAALEKGWRSASRIILLSSLIFCLPRSGWAAQSVRLSWFPSADATVVGYRIHYGTASGCYSETVNAGSQTWAVITGLTEGQTYYFVATAYNALGIESVPSNELAYTVPGFTLSLDQLPPAVTETTNAAARVPAAADKVFRLSSTPTAPARWVVEASGDLQTWKVLTFGTNPQANVTVALSSAPAKFFRLKSDVPGVSLVTQKVPTNGFPNSFILTTTGSAPANWTVESSSDLQTWSTLATGTNSPVNVAVVMSEAPAMFFRLKEE